MSALFISHSSRDAATAAELRDWLLQRGFRSLFLDFDPALGIPAGRNWEQELYRQLRACQAVIVLCSEHSMESDWCFAEITHARALGKIIFPVRVGPCNLRPALTELQVVDAIADRPAAYERLLQGLRTAGLEHLFPWDPQRPPYPGLLAFQEADAAVYFGREPDIRTGLDALNRVRRFGGARLLICLGASGSGKSSLMRAGILPRLKQDPESWLVLPVFRPLHEPIAELAAALAHAVPGDGPSRSWKLIARELEQASASSAIATKAWGDLLRELRLASPARESVVVFAVDQFEEALAATPQADRFLALLQALVGNPDSQAVVLATLRSDFLEALQKHPGFRVPFDTLSLGPLPVDGLAQVIEGPAQVAGVEIEGGLTPLLLADTEIEDGLPLLAFTLRKLWERDGATRRLTIATYKEALGGLHGAIAREAEAVAAIDALSDAEQRDLRTSFLAMARIDESGQYLRQAVRWSDLPAGIHPLLERFVSARLLVSGSEESERILEVAHEALFRVWKRLRSWLDADRDNLRLREGIRQAANEWNERARSAELLVHRGSRLEAAETLLREARFPLDTLQRDYLAACIGAREAAREAERLQVLARRRRVQVALASLSLGLLVASALSLWALGERRQATDRLASLHWVNGVTERDGNRDSLKALHHFMQAAALASGEADARSAFFAGELLAGAASLGAIVQPGDGLRGAVFGSDSHHVVTWNGAGHARTWALAAEGPRESPLHEGRARKIAASPRLTWTVLWSGDDAIEVRNSQTARSFAAASSADGMPAFSATEARIAVREGNVVRVWDQSSKTPLAVLEHPARVVGVALSRQGEQILTWDSARTARLWNARGGPPLGELRYAADIQGGAIGDASKQVLLWGKEAPASVWTVGGGSLMALSVEPGNNPSIMGAAFFDRSRRLVAWNYGGIGRARIFDLDRGIELARLAHDGAIRNVVFDRTERLVLTWSDDGTARLWDGDRLALRAILAHNDEVRGADFSPDESRILTWSADRTARVWDAASGYPLTMPLRHDGVVEGATFAPDGRSVLSFDQRSARWWPLRDDPESAVYTLRHDGRIVRAAFASAEGDVVTFTRDGLLHRWIRGDESEPPFALSKSLVDVVFDTQRQRMVGWDSSDALGSWDTGHGHAMTPLMRHDRSDFGIRGAKTSPDGRRILSWGDDRTARLWDGESGRLLAQLRHPGPVVGAELSRDSRWIVTWSVDRIVRVWDAESAKALVELPANEHGIQGVTLTRDAARILVWDTNGMLRVRDARSGADVGAFSHGTGVAVRGAALNGDESSLLTWDDSGLVRVWNSKSFDAAREPVVWQAGDVQSAAFAADERMVLTQGEAGARLWDSRNGQPLTVLFTLGGPMLGAVLRPDDRALLAWSEDTARVWRWAVELDAKVFDAVARQQVRSGTWLDNMGQVEVMPAQQWQAASTRAARDRPAR